MGFFDLFRKRESLDRPEEGRDPSTELEAQGGQLAEKALSYRSLGKFELALELLHQALTDYGYKPARILIGTTLILKEDYEDAVSWFETQIKELKETNDFPLIELYANLAVIYVNHYQDFKKALEIYAKALEAPRTAIYSKEDYLRMESSVYHDMAIVYRNNAKKGGDLMQALHYAEMHLQVQSDCPSCREIVDTVRNIMKQIGNSLGQ